MKTMRVSSVLGALFVLGCQGFDLSGGGNPRPPEPSNPEFTVTTPEDVRPVITAETPPPPISGGTLLITRDGKLAVAADPDRDRVSVVSIADQALLYTVPLEPGDEPGRVVEDDAGRVHVALRRGGAIVSIELATGKILTRRAVCGVPRGIAFDSRTDRLHVACGDGKLVTFEASGGDAVRTVPLPVDARDVIVTKTGLAVSRFKTAQLLELDDTGAVVTTVKPLRAERVAQPTFATSPDGTQIGVTPPPTPFEPIDPEVAWRTVAAADGTMLMLHQYALAIPVKLPPAVDPAKTDPSMAGDPGGSAGDPVLTDPGGGSPYGGSFPGGCGALVTSAVSRVDADGTVTMGAPLPGTVLAVDASVSPDGRWVAVAEAGTRDPAAPVAPFGPSTSPAAGSVEILDTANLVQQPDLMAGQSCASVTNRIGVEGQATAVAFNPATDDAARAAGTWFVVQTREPAELSFFHDPGGTVTAIVALGGAEVLDTGHEIFHRDSGGGIACASCHAEGEEDGRVWQFDPLGDRRTQAIDVGLRGTAPFHWDGDMPTFDSLVTEVFVHRMGGPVESPERSAALSNWVFSLTPRAPIADPAADAVKRGKALFESKDVGCSSCHGGEHFTANINAEVGTTTLGHSLQVPSLRGVGYRAPFLHDGRAATLSERFEPKGGGDKHGHTSQLTQDQIADLVQYLESI